MKRGSNPDKTFNLFDQEINTALYICLYYFVMVHVFLEMSFKGRTLSFLLFLFIIILTVAIYYKTSMWVVVFARHCYALARVHGEISALLCSFWAFKAKRDHPSMIFWFQDMPWVSHSNWVYGIFTRFIIYQAKCQIAGKISSTRLLTELHSVKYHPLQCLKSITKYNVRPIKKFKSMCLYDKRLKGLVHFQIKMSL